MGVKIKELFLSHGVESDWYHGKRVAVDGHNVGFRYLTSFMGPDGGPLRNKEGRVTGHLIGISNLVRHLRERGTEPIWIWDGEIHDRKRDTVNKRIDDRKKAEMAAAEALARGETEEYNKLQRRLVYLNGQMIHDATIMLEAMGVSVVTAPHDGERFGAALCHHGMADAVATEDYDALVAGAPEMLRKVGSQDPFLHRLKDAEDNGLSVRDLQEIAIVCGTDWHPGVRGFGPKTALKAIEAFGSLEYLFENPVGDTRFHKLIQKSDLDLETFLDLRSYIADLPTPGPIRKLQADPEYAATVAVDLGIRPDRLLAAL